MKVAVSAYSAVHIESLEVVPAVVTGLTILNAKTVVYELTSCDKYLRNMQITFHTDIFHQHI